MAKRANVVPNQGSSIAEGDESNRLQINVLSDLIDRWEGMSTTLEVWAEKPCTEFVSEKCAVDAVRERVATFFVSRELVAVFEALLRGVRSLKPEDVQFSKEQVFLAVMDRPDMDTSAAGVVTELLLPMLLDKGIVSPNLKYSRHIRYGFKRVVLNDIKLDVAMHQVSQAVASAKASAIDPKTKYAVRPLAEAFAESARAIGLALLDMNELSPVIEDLVKGVRAHLDPLSQSGGVTGSVPAEWRNHRVVAELAQNLVFVRAALAMAPGEELSLSSEGWRLEKWAPIILAAIKSSLRYSWVGKQEALRHFSLFKVRDVKGVPLSTVVCRYATVQPVAQAVFSIQDAMMPTAFNINATKDRISEAIQTAYGQADFATDRPARLLHGILTDAAEAGWGAMQQSYVVDAIGAGFSLSDIALLLSSRVYVEIGDTGVVLDRSSQTLADMRNSAKAGKHELSADAWDHSWNPRWWFVIPTTEKALNVYEGTHYGSEVLTTSPEEALLAAEEFESHDPIPHRPQVLGPAAFNTRVIGFDDRILQPVSQRFSFDIEINGVKMRGVLRAKDFASLRSSVHTNVVVPHFNSEVIQGVEQAYSQAQNTLVIMGRTVDETDPNVDSDAFINPTWRNGVAPAPAFFDYMNRRVARDILRIAQMLSPAFRQEVHMAIIERSLATGKLTVDEATLMRARLQQKTFAACADIIALKFFLFLQGIDITSWTELLDSETMLRVCMEIGSDR